MALTRRFFNRDPETLAQALLGQRLVRVLPAPEGDPGGAAIRLAGTIVETEAYLGVRDRAAHSYAGRRTPRVESMYAPPGTAYVYFTYGMHYCMNVVCGEPDEPVAVLVRALEPTEGLEHMYAVRTKAARDRDLCSGPAKLCQALRIDRGLDGEDLLSSPRLFIERARSRPIRAGSLVNTSRIGVESSGSWAAEPLRWYVDCAHVSVRRRRDRAAT